MDNSISNGQAIDEVLGQIPSDGFIHLTMSDTNAYVAIVHRAHAYGLLRKDDRSNYWLTQLGHEVLEQGGFDAWQTAAKKKEDELHRATLKTADATVDAATSARHSKYAYASALIAVAAFVGPPLFDKSKSDLKTRDSILTALQGRVEVLTSLLKVQPQSPPTTSDTLKRRSSQKVVR